MIKKTYSPEELTGKYIVCSTVLAGRCDFLECVTYISGERSGLPVLYDSIDQALSDEYFDPDWDEVIPAVLYYELKLKRKKHEAELLQDSQT